MTKSQRMWRREQERRRRERENRMKRRMICTAIVVIAVIAVAVLAIVKACTSDRYSTSTPGEEGAGIDVTSTPQEPQTAVYTPVRDISEVNTSFFDNSAFLGDVVADTINMYGLLPQASFYTSVGLNLENVYTTAVGYGTVPAADTLKSTKFNKIFLSFGSGYLGQNDARGFGERYEELVEKVKTYQQNAQIYVIAIPPSSRTASESALYGATVQNIADYNRQIENIAEEYKLFYVDSVSALANSNRYLADGVSYDGICLNKGCVTDLLYYMVNSSYVPDGSNNSPDVMTSAPGGDEAAVTTASAEPTQTPTAEPQMQQEQIAPTPQPTVNVLKDSAAKKNQQ